MATAAKAATAVTTPADQEEDALGDLVIGVRAVWQSNAVEFVVYPCEERNAAAPPPVSWSELIPTAAALTSWMKPAASSMKAFPWTPDENDESAEEMEPVAVTASHTSTASCTHSVGRQVAVAADRGAPSSKVRRDSAASATVEV